MTTETPNPETVDQMNGPPEGWVQDAEGRWAPPDELERLEAEKLQQEALQQARQEGWAEGFKAGRTGSEPDSAVRRSAVQALSEADLAAPETGQVLSHGYDLGQRQERDRVLRLLRMEGPDGLEDRLALVLARVIDSEAAEPYDEDNGQARAALLDLADAIEQGEHAELDPQAPDWWVEPASKHP